ncbi:MAG: DUF4065 domain-containing protein [Helicobacteraceae bacterium]|nr:DUF4065 domain-containing protein [Helicobacteraceae bacterium]
MEALKAVRYFLFLQDKLTKSIEKSDKIKQNESVTHLKMQKLLYYAQGLSLVYNTKPLFKEKIEAWEHGPVVREVYEKLKQYKKDDLSKISELVCIDDSLSEEEKSVIEMAFIEYGRFTATYLRNKTHEEPTWKEAWSKGKNTIITHESMRDYFKKEQRLKAEILYLKSKDFRWLFN